MVRAIPLVPLKGCIKSIPRIWCMVAPSPLLNFISNNYLISFLFSPLHMKNSNHITSQPNNSTTHISNSNLSSNFEFLIQIRISIWKWSLKNLTHHYHCQEQPHTLSLTSPLWLAPTMGARILSLLGRTYGLWVSSRSLKSLNMTLFSSFIPLGICFFSLQFNLLLFHFIHKLLQGCVVLLFYLII